MQKQTVLPRWRGFNLLNMFRAKASGSPRDYDLNKAFGRFQEEDFQIISDLGFDFVRLPLNYWLWVDDKDPFKINSAKLDAIDEAVRYGEKYGVHVDISFHRGPGFSVSDELVEPFDLWHDQTALDAFKLHWVTFAKRYKGISSDKVSFNLINEPKNVAPEPHAVVMREAVKSIREADKDRLVILDGLAFGNNPMTELGDLADCNVAQSCRGYIPHGITHYRAGWVDKEINFPEPKWPGAFADTGTWDRRRLERHYSAWAAVAENFGMGVHCGECGCYNRTPHPIMLAWLEDLMQILESHNFGYALWNLKGNFGILESGRSDTQYVDYRGYQLDKKMLDVLQKH